MLPAFLTPAGRWRQARDLYRPIPPGTRQGIIIPLLRDGADCAAPVTVRPGKVIPSCVAAGAAFPALSRRRRDRLASKRAQPGEAAWAATRHTRVSAPQDAARTAREAAMDGLHDNR